MAVDKLHYFPTQYDLDRSLVLAAPIERKPIDLTGRTPVKTEMIEAVLRCS